MSIEGQFKAQLDQSADSTSEPAVLVLDEGLMSFSRTRHPEDVDDRRSSSSETSSLENTLGMRFVASLKTYRDESVRAMAKPTC